MDRPRRHDLPRVLHDRERLMRRAMKQLEAMFPRGTGLALMAFDLGDAGHMSWISNAQREDMIVAMQEQIERLRMGTDDTAGRGES